MNNIKPYKWKLVWQEQFDQTKLDLDTWDYELGYIRNNELQWYTNHLENCRLEDGKLYLRALENKEGKHLFTSASINTKKSASFLYGRFEMRAKLPQGVGIWPAFWTLGQHIDEVPWPDCGEIDIMEMVGGEPGDSIVHTTAHWGEKGEHMQKGVEFALSQGKFADDFHLFSMEWYPERIIWFVDGEECFHLDITDENREGFNKPHYILLNLAVGGSWAGAPDESTIFPQEYIVDYVRIYQQETLNSEKGDE